MSLANALQKIKDGAKERIPEETLRLMQQATKELSASGIMEGVKGVGAKFPDFQLPDSDNNQVSLKKLLQGGPLVVTFYRGDW